MDPSNDLEYMRSAVKAAQNGQEAAIKLAEENAKMASHYRELVQARRRLAFWAGATVTLFIVLIVIWCAYLIMGVPLFQ